MKFRLQIDGRDVPSGGLAEALKSSVLKAGAQRVAANLDGLACPEHGSTPQIVTTPDGSGYGVQSCCELLDSHVRERFGVAVNPLSSQVVVSETPNAALMNELPERPPRAFISHTSADKDRFVLQFCHLLRERGIEPWLDERELLPGDNLVDKIFNDGISSSDVFIVVLSANSIERPWVKKELSVAVVQKIEGVVKALIPIVLDGVTVPAVLKDTVWEKVDDINDIARHVDRIAAAIFGRIPATIAPAPAYTGMSVHKLAGLEPDDERIFVMACEQLLANRIAYPYIDFRSLEQRASDMGMPQEYIYECIHVLDKQGYFHDVGGYHGDERPLRGKVSPFAFERYLETYRSDEYRDEKRRILSAIVNENMHYSRQIVQELRIHEYIVDHVIEGLERAGDVMASHHSSGIDIRPEPSLPRRLRQLEG